MSLSSINVSTYLTAAHDFADEARIVAQRFTGSDFSVSTKADKSLVTKADIEIESTLRQRISAMFPGHGVIGEEFPPDNQDSPYQWILDPIDGTEEFVHGVPTFGCIISLEYKSDPIVSLIDHPALNMRLAASKNFGTFCNEKKISLSDDSPSQEKLRLGISKRSNFTRYGDESEIFDAIVQTYPNFRVYDSCFAYSCAASGGIDVMIDFNVRLWDISACRLLCEEAGGSFSWIKQQVTPGGFTTYSAVFGKKRAVKEINNRFFPAAAASA